MAPGKVKLAFIANDSKRNITYKKRKQSMLKKAEELSTLCGVEACAIVYGPNDPQPEVWPSESSVQNVLEKFRRLPEWKQKRKMTDQESFVAQSIVKGKQNLQKIVNENKEKEMAMFMVQCLNTQMFQPGKNMTAADLNVLSLMIEQNLKDISRRMEMLNVNQVTPSQPDMQTPAAYQPPLQTPPSQPQNLTPAYEPQMQTLPYQPQMQNPSYQPQLQTSSHHSLMQNPTYQPHMKAPEDMTLLNYSNGSDMGFMDLLFGDGDKTILPPFEDPNFQL